MHETPETEISNYTSCALIPGIQVKKKGNLSKTLKYEHESIKKVPKMEKKSINFLQRGKNPLKAKLISMVTNYKVIK